jgi:hypothetical protein
VPPLNFPPKIVRQRICAARFLRVRDPIRFAPVHHVLTVIANRDVIRSVVERVPVKVPNVDTGRNGHRPKLENRRESMNRNGHFPSLAAYPEFRVLLARVPRNVKLSDCSRRSYYLAGLVDGVALGGGG